MRSGMKTMVIIASGALTLLAACGDSSSGDGVGGVTASEAEALNEAAEMLDSRPKLSALEPEPRAD